MATITVTGATGFIGSALSRVLLARGDQVRVLRRPGSRGSIEGAETRTWDPDSGELEEGALSGSAAVVHLAGEGVANARWTAAQKLRIKESRVRGTRMLADALARLANKPEVFVCASAIGIYGDRGAQSIDETSSFGDDFLAEVGQAWEAATASAESAGVRVVLLRFGLVLDPAGGVLKRLLPPFRLGLGGALGDGRQFMSWVARQDAVRAVLHALDTPTLRGPVNVTAPEPVTNQEFTSTLGKVLRRPTLLGVPAFAARVLFGEMADGALLAGARVVPRRLLEAGFTFEHTQLEAYLRAALCARN